MEKRLRTKFIQYDDVGNLLCYKCNKYKPEDLRRLTFISPLKIK